MIINAFGTAGELGFRERLQLAGVSWDDVKKVVVPFPQMPAALELGNADVVVTIFPMQAAIMANKAIGGKVLGRGTSQPRARRGRSRPALLLRDRQLARQEREAALAFGRAYLRAQKEH